MAKPINTTCYECSKVNWRLKSRPPRPNCYIPKACSKKICYYRRIEHYRSLLRKYHRYLKFLGDKCLVCGAKDNLEAHHIKSQAMGGLDAQDNIITLCNACHKVITIYTRRIGVERKIL